MKLSEHLRITDADDTAQNGGVREIRVVKSTTVETSAALVRVTQGHVQGATVFELSALVIDPSLEGSPAQVSVTLHEGSDAFQMVNHKHGGTQRVIVSYEKG